MRVIFIFVWIICLLLGTGCANPNLADNETPSSAYHPGLYEIFLTSDGFSPDEIRIPVGTTVSWFNKTDTWKAVGELIPTGESVGANPYGLSGKLEPESKFELEFALPGTWEYWCPQTGQTGKVCIVDYE